MSADGADFAIRRVDTSDRREVIELLSSSLGWVPDDTFESFFAWKHEENPFGVSPAWVAVDGRRIAGFRTFMRWVFDGPGGTRRAVRAVDTATHPDYQGRGIFRALTTHALDELARDGVDFVYNTPNSQSRPGYLKMGWVEVGRLAAAIRPLGVASALRMLRARVPAQRWSEPASSGHAASELLADSRLDDLIERLGPDGTLRTQRSAPYLRWRYGFEPLRYRAVAVDDDPARGVAIFRIRARGDAREAALCEVLAPRDDPAAVPALLQAVVKAARAADADYVIRLGGPILDRNGFARLPGQGPVFTWRRVNVTGAPPTLSDWRLELGDVELM